MTTRPGARQLRLHARDLYVLRLLADRRAEQLEQIAAEHFPSRNRARDRLSQHARAGLVERVLVQDFQTPGRFVNAYTLTRKGSAALRRRVVLPAAPTDRRHNPPAAAVIPHQLAVNHAGRLIGATLTPDHHIALPPQASSHHRPDAAYSAATPDDEGRRQILLEVDLGHYNRDRVVNKLAGFLANPDAKGVLFVVPNDERLELISRWAREAYGSAIYPRLGIYTFADLEDGHFNDEHFTPAAPPPA